MNLFFFDTETTGNEPKDFLCQIAWKKHNDPEMKAGLFKPPLPIPFEAMAVHNITNKMVADMPPFKNSPLWNEAKEIFESTDNIVIAHNAIFDLGMLKKEDIVPANYICTLRVARELDSESKLSRYNLQYLRYALDLEVEGLAHSADGDVLVLEQLFNRLFKKMIEQEGSEEKALKKMIEISSRPSILKTFNFGKYNGKAIAEVQKTDAGYLEWLLKSKLENSPDDIDWIYTLKHFLGKL